MPHHPDWVLRPAARRGQTRTDWLDSRHSFSFGDYHDPSAMGWGALRVINDDRVAPGAGFPPHGHRDMEILTLVLDGALAHRDSLGHGTTIPAGDLQAMTAGTGIRHSEYNASADGPVHFLQIWIIPDRSGLAPAYQQRHFAPVAGAQLLAAPPAVAAARSVIAINQQLSVWRLRLAHPLTWPAGGMVWLHTLGGAARLDDLTLTEGDGVGVPAGTALPITPHPTADLLLFAAE